METIKKTLIAGVTAVVTWLLLSYLFFPIKLSASYEIYFIETVTHMAPLKAFITIVMMLVAIFIYEQKTKKKSSLDK